MENNIKQLPIEFGKTYIIRLLVVYKSLFKKAYGFNPTVSIGAFGKVMKGLIDDKSELQIAVLLCIFFEWRGISGDDEREYEKLTKVAFNFYWLPSNINALEVYARNVLKMDLDNEESNLIFIKKNIQG